MSKEITALLRERAALPVDAAKATLIGRVWLPAVEGPALVRVANGRLIDLSGHAATSAQLCADPDLSCGSTSSMGRISAQLTRSSSTRRKVPATLRSLAVAPG